jgi:hypothetical protein
MNTALRVGSLLLLAIAACHHTVAPPLDEVDNWRSTQSSCDFTFRAPPDLVRTPVQGIDSCVDRFRGTECEYDGGSGWYGSGLLSQESGQRNYVSEPVDLGGVEATLVSFEQDQDLGTTYVVGVEAALLDASDTAVSFIASCRTAQAREVATKVMLSVRVTL